MGRASSFATLLLTGLLVAGCNGPSSTSAKPESSASAAPTAQASTATGGQPPSAPVTCSGQPTAAETEGPYFKAGSPERTSLVDTGMSGTRITITGHVLTLDCRPLSGVVLDFWQADASGAYDNAGYRLRGHQVTDAGGRYTLETVVPGDYPGRTQHIHVKVAAPGKPVLTTQLYFPGSARNQTDSLFKPALLLQVSDSASGKAAAFDFVLDVR